MGSLCSLVRLAALGFRGRPSDRPHNAGGHITWTFSWPATIPPIGKVLVPAAISSPPPVENIPGQAEQRSGAARKLFGFGPEPCSPSARNPVRINAESCSASSRNRVRLAPDSALLYLKFIILYAK